MRIRKGFDFTLTLQLGPRLMGHLSFSQASHQTNTCIPTLTEVLPFSVTTITKFQVSCRKVLDEFKNQSQIFRLSKRSKIRY